MKRTKPHYLLISNFTDKQQLKIKSSIVDANNHLNEVHPSFNRLHKELSPGFYLVDNFPNCFSFHIVNWKNVKNINAHICSLDKLFENYFLNPNTVLVISNTSIKNNVTTFVLHIHSSHSFLMKTTYHAVNITSTKVELFVIRCGINQAVQVPNIKHIIVITDTIHTIRHIFDSSFYSY